MKGKLILDNGEEFEVEVDETFTIRVLRQKL